MNEERALTPVLRVIVLAIGIAAVCGGALVASTELRVAHQGAPMGAALLAALVAAIVILAGVRLIRAAIRGTITVRSPRR